MIRVAILGDIGSGKSYVARTFGYPVFNADDEVGKIYKENKKIFKRLKKTLPNYLHSFPIRKIEISNAILANNKNLKKIVKIVHPEIKKKLNIFLKKHNNKKIVVLDIPLLLENKIDKKEDILVYVQSKKLDILKKLKKRKNFNRKLFNIFKKIQLPLNIKKEKSKFIIKNNFAEKPIKKIVNKIVNKIL
jgi:dephospho-CoA kinase